MNVSQFLRAVRFVLHVEPEESRPYSNVVAFDFQSDSLSLVATDGVRMAVVELETAGVEPRLYCVKHADLEAAVEQLGEAVGDICFFSMGADALGAVTENCVSLSIPLSGVSFPDRSRCTNLPFTGAPELWVPAGQWAAAFEALGEYQEGHDVVRVQVSGKNRAVKISSADGKAFALIMPCLEPQ